MTTSTDKTKKKGPIRWEAVIPTFLVMALIVGYFHFFFDHHMRRALEYVATQINGAEVNIGRFATYVLGARLEVDDIQVTDKNKPERNLIQVGNVRFELLWDALLRAKLVVDQAQVLNIQALTPRSRPGFVVPPPPPDAPGESLVERVQSEVAAQTRKKFNENFLGDIAAVLGGTDPKQQIQNIQSELKSDARLKELEKELKEKKAKWNQRLKELPQSEELKQYEVRIKTLKFDLSNPAEFAKNAKEAEKIIREASEKVKLIEETSKDVKGDAANYTQAFNDLEKMLKEDVADLQKRLKIPNLDGKELSQQLFMSMIESRLGGVRKYVEVARKYMPPKRSKEEKLARAEEQVVPPKRGSGRTYEFPVTTGYPLFWLKHAALSSELGQSEYSGNIKGEIRDLSTDPPFIKKPTLFIAAGDFPKQNIAGFDAKITLDHTTEVPRDTAEIKIARFPVENLELSRSPEVHLSMQKALGSSALNAVIVNESLELKMQSAFTELAYDLRAKNKTAQEILERVIQGIPKVTVNASVSGSLADFSLHVNSNLGDELAAGFKKQLDVKIAEAQAQLRKMIDERIGQDKAKLKQELDQTIGGLTKDLDGKKAEVDKVVQQAKTQVEGDKGKGKGSGKKLEEEGKKLLKKLKFGG